MWLEVLKWAGLVILLLFAVFVLWSYFDYQKEKTEALRKAACILMGLPAGTKLKEFEKMRKKIRKY